ncbi:hypothetical protein DES53_11985 [Roseimicrobium gellanilyticum]|uniref:Uncharacterized protein n=1 Tax=Roseimicrobium gellanilyticum TaxID=748857 RepID=A0A366H2Z2_9BACT|nr:hypothetical protein [Roseimicrobium gellanilyticum]RBP35919.1 hypothetical protein DES53_11985 [Roseimicrobium gellanilyticum]
MEDQAPEPHEEEDPIRTCAYTGERRPQSQMVRIGPHYVVAEYKDAAVQFLQQGNEFDPPGKDMQAPPVRLMPLVTKAWDIFRQHWLLFFLINVTVALPVSILEGYVSTQVDPVEGGMRLLFFSISVNGIFISVGHAAIFAAMSRIWMGKVPTYGNAWFVTMARLGNVVLASIFVLILVMAGFFLCLVPGFLASVWLAFTICIVMDEGRSAWPAVERSADLARGRFWLLFLYFIAVTLPLTVLVFIYQVVVQFVPTLSHWLLDAVILTILSTPLLLVQVFTFVLYRALRSAPPVVS